MLHLLPTLCFRNTWSWMPGAPRPVLRALDGVRAVIEAEHESLGCAGSCAAHARSAVHRERDQRSACGACRTSPFMKDGIDAHVVRNEPGRVNPALTGTRAAAWYR